MRIAVDAMGGDHAPREVVAGTVAAASEFVNTRFILVGDQMGGRWLRSIDQGG